VSTDDESHHGFYLTDWDARQNSNGMPASGHIPCALPRHMAAKPHGICVSGEVLVKKYCQIGVRYCGYPRGPDHLMLARCGIFLIFTIARAIPVRLAGQYRARGRIEYAHQYLKLVDCWHLF
jgi:hypothetical protein